MFGIYPHSHAHVYLRDGGLGYANLGSVISDRTTGVEWVERLRGGGITVDERLAEILSTKLKATKGVYEIVIKEIHPYYEPNYGSIVRSGELNGFSEATLEIACLVREKFSNDYFKKLIDTSNPEVLITTNELGVYYPYEAIGHTFVRSCCPCCYLDSFTAFRTDFYADNTGYPINNAAAIFIKQR